MPPINLPRRTADETGCVALLRFVFVCDARTRNRVITRILDVINARLEAILGPPPNHPYHDRPPRATRGDVLAERGTPSFQGSHVSSRRRSLSARGGGDEGGDAGYTNGLQTPYSRSWAGLPRIEEEYAKMGMETSPGMLDVVGGRSYAGTGVAG